jgi:uncharacterized protein (DUF885 family)
VMASNRGALAAIAHRFEGDALDGAIRSAQAAYADFTDWLEQSYLARAATVDGVGPERYPRMLRRFLGSTPDLDETVRWGWEEVRRLRARMHALSDGDIGGVVRALHSAPAAEPERFLAMMRERQAIALAAIDEHFDVPDGVRRLDVRRVPPGSPPGAWYVPPSEALSRPGTVWYSMPDAPQALWDEVSTAYHEGFPGHHLQLGVQVTLRDRLCRLHRVADSYSGYAEGWALYAEQLMGELGGYERPEYELGYLANQMARACRVVFDVGAHMRTPIPDDAPFHPGAAWTFDLGVELMTEWAGLNRDTARSEVTRYYGWPGQAPSYKLGQRVILDLRSSSSRPGGRCANSIGGCSAAATSASIASPSSSPERTPSEWELEACFDVKMGFAV